MAKTFVDNLSSEIKNKQSVLAVGLDPQMRYMPKFLKEWAIAEFGKTNKAAGELFFRFNKEIIDAVSDFVVAVKPQIAFYEQYGMWGIWAYEQTIAYAKEKGLLVVGDIKRGDGGDTAKAYANAYLGEVDFFDGKIKSDLACDAVTLQPWIGSSSLNPFIDIIKEKAKGAFVVCKTSFKPNSEIEQIKTSADNLVWQDLANLINNWAIGTQGDNGYQNLGAVIGATYPEEAKLARQLMPKAWFLVPGYGAQGGGADGAVTAVNKDGLGCIVNSSRGIIYAYHRVSKSDFVGNEKDFAKFAKEAAKAARDDLEAAIKRKKFK